MEGKTIYAEQAADLIIELLKARPWLNQPDRMNPGDFDAAHEAAGFLLMLDHRTTDWGDTSPAGRRVASALLIALLYKLIHPESPYRGHSWRIPTDTDRYTQAIHLIRTEILGSGSQRTMS
ncbi:hypothetical protein [Burkholderia cenocepacia]|uniref:hypothetical protein n=1 Tax=Burkholderia cenocepacia TaxID=95486 RepID=UPI001BA9A2DC|nr:hypothetical protein [Burkholderia cenocepacia]QUN38660.1 hypothetical protein KEH56_10565 [Burkholderia cenocepacia]QUO29437.1 hypothetical protein KEH57_23410 [Burkholderia cenocepacia]